MQAYQLGDVAVHYLSPYELRTLPSIAPQKKDERTEPHRDLETIPT